MCSSLTSMFRDKLLKLTVSCFEYGRAHLPQWKPGQCASTLTFANELISVNKSVEHFINFCDFTQIDPAKKVSFRNVHYKVPWTRLICIGREMLDFVQLWLMIHLLVVYWRLVGNLWRVSDQSAASTLHAWPSKSSPFTKVYVRSVLLILSCIVNLSDMLESCEKGQKSLHCEKVPAAEPSILNWRIRYLLSEFRILADLLFSLNNMKIIRKWHYIISLFIFVFGSDTWSVKVLGRSASQLWCLLQKHDAPVTTASPPTSDWK